MKIEGESMTTKSAKGPTSLSEAIEQLESVGHHKSKDLKEHLENDIADIKQALEGIKPFLNEFTEKIETEAKNGKHQVEQRVKESPWIALGVVGLVAFILGWIFGHNRK